MRKEAMLAILVVSVLALALPVSAQVSHKAEQVRPGAFGFDVNVNSSSNYTFPGRIGIGVGSGFVPSAALHVNASGVLINISNETDTLIFANSTHFSVNTTNVNFGSGGVNLSGNLSLYDGGILVFADGTVQSTAFLGAVSVDGLANSTAWNRTGTNVILHNEGDLVGIGTANPVGKLNINGTGALLNVTNGTRTALFVNSSHFIINSSYFEVGVGGVNTSGNVSLYDGGILVFADGTEQSTAGIGDGAGNSTAWNRTGTNVILHNEGDLVGIGTANPVGTLNINGSGVVLNVSNSTHSFFVVNAVNGYIGVGIDNPLAPLHVNGSGAAKVALNVSGNLSVTNSVTFGDGTSATGARSFAMGISSVASGRDSFAQGASNTASGFYSTAFGTGTTASGNDALAIGSGTEASASHTLAMGFGTYATANMAVAQGEDTTASGLRAVSIGQDVTASGVQSIAAGQFVNASSLNTFTFGFGPANNNRLQNDRQNSFAVGFNSTTATLFVGTHTSEGQVDNFVNIGGFGNSTSRLNVSGNVSIDGANTGLLFGDGTYQSSAATTGATGWTISGATLYNNSDNLLVGIGTATPTAVLHVNGSGVVLNVSNSTHSFLIVNGTNQIRVGIDDETPEFALSVGGDGGIIATGTFGQGKSLTASGAGTRMIWYPRKAAFRAGRVDNDQWDEGNMGNYSVAFGLNTTASKNYTFAAGFNTSATGIAAIALGNSSSASGHSSIAAGSFANATGAHSVAFGLRTTTKGINAVAFGEDTSASGDEAFAVGRGSVASGNQAFAAGSSSIASGLQSVALGSGSIADGLVSFAAGHIAQSRGIRSTAIGPLTTASGNYSVAIGDTTSSSGYASTAFGSYAGATGNYSTAFGHFTVARGNYSTAFGAHTNADGYYSTAFGQSTNASGYYSTAFGRDTLASGNYSTALGYNTSATGNYSTSFGDYTLASGASSLAGGINTTSNGTMSVAIGQWLNVTSPNSYVFGKGDSFAIPFVNGIENSFAIGFNGSAAPGLIVRSTNDAGGNANRVGINTTAPTVALGIVGRGLVTEGILTGGPDIAEAITVSDLTIEAGDVVVADSSGKELLAKSTVAYQTSVVGIISTDPGFIMFPREGMSQSRTLQNNERLLALAGRVPTKVTTENGPIVPGDILTTSPTAGHAMKFSLLQFTGDETSSEFADKLNENEKRRNTIMGKALESCEESSCKIIVLVTP